MKVDGQTKQRNQHMFSYGNIIITMKVKMNIYRKMQLNYYCRIQNQKMISYGMHIIYTMIKNVTQWLEQQMVVKKELPLKTIFNKQRMLNSSMESDYVYQYVIRQMTIFFSFGKMTIEKICQIIMIVVVIVMCHAIYKIKKLRES